MTVQPRVLVVDDDESIRNLVSRVLARNEYEIDQAKNGVEAIEMLRSSKYEAVILDLMMPAKNGFDVIEFLRSSRPEQLQAILVMTAASDKYVANVDRASIGGILPKPFDIAELSRRVEELVAVKPGSEE